MPALNNRLSSLVCEKGLTHFEDRSIQSKVFSVFQELRALDIQFSATRTVDIEFGSRVLGDLAHSIPTRHAPGIVANARGT